MIGEFGITGGGGVIALTLAAALSFNTPTARAKGDCFAGGGVPAIAEEIAFRESSHPGNVSIG
jgi:hypothetical protein